MTDLVKRAYEVAAIRGETAPVGTLVFQLAQRIEELEREIKAAKETADHEFVLRLRAHDTARASLATIRREALEEAARKCEAMNDDYPEDAYLECAEAIRKLADEP